MKTFSTPPQTGEKDLSKSIVAIIVYHFSPKSAHTDMDYPTYLSYFTLGATLLLALIVAFFGGLGYALTTFLLQDLDVSQNQMETLKLGALITLFYTLTAIITLGVFATSSLYIAHRWGWRTDQRVQLTSPQTS